MILLIDKREIGVSLRRIINIRGVTTKAVQQYLGLGCIQIVNCVNMPTIDNLYALS